MPPVPTPADPEHFDWRRVAREAGISSDELSQLVRFFESQYPDDLMLRELHILRACRAVSQGRVSLREVLREAPPSSAA